jgi:quercetin 2,3-dioxygenase
MTSTPRTVERIIQPEPTSDGAGVKLRRIIASQRLDYLDPFLLLDHFGSDDPDDYIAGFPVHPHRGMETVTYMLAGVVNHKDSLGHSGSIGAGDVQWMTAGSGIMHEEMPQVRGGHLNGFQLWVNLPAKLKMTPPRYQEFSASQIPVVTRPDGSKVKVIAGTFDDVRGPVTNIAADPTYLDITLPRGVSLEHAIPRGHTAFVYVFEGSGSFGTTEVSGLNMAILSDGDSIGIKAGDGGVRFLLISGKPLGEPVARYGPFVMNTEGEIRQALVDLQRGTFVKA